MDAVSYDENFNATGWFSVGPSHESHEGWMRADDVVPWRQALALAFTNPGPSERRPVIMFDTDKSLDYMLDDFETGAATPDAIYDRIMASDIPDGIVSREVNSWVDIDKSFYLMPILDHKDLSSLRGDGDMRGIQLAALTTASRSSQSDACDIRERDADDCIAAQSGGWVSGLNLDMMFVVDMTASMGPYIDAVRNAIQQSVQLVGERFASEAENFRFGLVGYRDVVELSPGIEFVARNFTPQMLSVEDFASVLGDGSADGGTSAIKESEVGSGDFPEEVFAGLEMAINANWTQDAARVLVLVGDASGHPVSHPKNTSGLDEKSIREMADHNNVYIASVYVGSEESPDYSVARNQFEALAAGDGDSNIAFAIATGSAESLERSLRDTIEKVLGFVAEGNFGSIASGNTDSSDSAGQAVLSAVRAAFVDYIGAEAQPPANVVAWASDRDIADYSKKSFDIKVMLGRKDMEELQDLLKGLLETLNEGSASSTFVFAQVQGGATASSYDLGIENTDAIVESELVPKWISDLPYKSEVLTLTLEEFLNSSADDRSRFESRLDSLVEFYDEALSRPDGWILLNEQASVDDRIYMLDITNLP
ncbi:MAG: VWA domain-containing protein [Albidovulum sp.]|nr:VWA domain-containing protein [Albidovulum sp.]